MTRQEKADRIGTLLDELYPAPPIPLDHHDGFTLLIAVLLSAQTTDERVNMCTPSLFAKASTPVAMAELAVEDILESIKTCGLAPTKAKNVRKLSELLVERHDGAIPETLEELEDLPGVGHKTASVVMAQWFGVPAFPVDTHIHRLAQRWGLTKEGNNVVKTEADLKSVFDRETWNRRHLQIIYFGREYCPARSHDFEGCPVCGWAMSQAARQREVERKKR
jgi:endonuclease-3